MRFQGFLDFIRVQKGLDPLFQVGFGEKNGQAIGDMADQGGHHPAGALKPDLLEKAALSHPRFNKGRTLLQNCGLSFRYRNIDRYPVVYGMVSQNMARVCQDWIILGQGGQDVGIKFQALQTGHKEPDHGQNQN
jgi:hypothetical protein